VFADPVLFALERSAFLEALTVMRAQGLRPVGFPSYPVSLLAWAWRSLPNWLLRPVLKRLVATGRGDKPPSLQIGLASGRKRSEAQYLNGAVVNAAERLELDAPVNRVLLETLMGIARGEIPWDDYRQQPQKLIAAVRAGKG
jgi:2-dehydropantoate 2-reductase